MGPALVVLIVTLGTLSQPLGTDLYLAALPAIRNDYGAPVSVVQLTLAVQENEPNYFIQEPVEVIVPVLAQKLAATSSETGGGQ